MSVDAFLEAIAPPAWHRHAACRGMGPDLFYGDRGEGGQTARTARKVACDRCPVRQDCREAGLYEHYGVWGGTAESDRRRIRRQRRLDTPANPPAPTPEPAPESCPAPAMAEPVDPARARAAETIWDDDITLLITRANHSGFGPPRREAS